MPIYLFARDKANHFLYGTLVALITLGLCHILYRGHLTHAFSLAALFSAFLMGVLKEVTDYIVNRQAVARGETPTHGVEWADMVVTTLGGAVVAVAHYL